MFGMGRTALQPGEHSPIDLAAYRLDDRGHKVKVDKTRQATIWRARCLVRLHNGDKRDLTRWAPTKHEAETAMSAALDDLLSVGLALRPTMPLLDAGKVWLEWIERPESGLSQRTIDDYQAGWRRCVKDDPECPIRGLTLSQANDAQLLIAYLQHVADTRGTGAAHLARCVMAGVLNMAIKRGALHYNAMKSVGVVKAKTTKESEHDHRRSMTREERDSVIAAADKKVADARDPRSVRKWQAVADLVAFMAGTGCRIGEARTLPWTALNLENGAAHIEGTKTTASDRVVEMPRWLTERLSKRDPDTTYVFTTWTPTRTDDPRPVNSDPHPFDQSNLAGFVRAVLDDAGLTWATPHTFRRTVATDLHEAGKPLVKIADQLGHSDPAMTMSVYLGRSPDLSGAGLADAL